MSSASRRRLTHGLLVGLACAGLFGLLQASSLLEPLELRAYDARARLLADAGRADPRILLVLVDQASLDYFAEEQAIAWPWPRSLYEPIVRFVRQGGARAVLFDVIFSELSVFGPEDDAVLGSVLGERPDSVVAVNLHAAEPGEQLPASRGLEIRSAERHRSQRAADLPWAVLPVPEILEPAARVGNVTFPGDRDGVYRRIPIYSWHRGMPVPSLFTAGAAVLRPDARWERLPRGLRFGDVRMEGDPESGLLLRYRGPSRTYRSLRAAGVIQSWLQLRDGETPEIPPETFRDSVVLVGFSAHGLLDLRPSPLDRKHFGVEIQATALDCLLHGDFVRPARLPWLWTALCALAVGVGASVLPRARHQVLLLIAALAVAEGLALASYALGRDAPQALPLLAVLVTFLAAGLVSYAREGRQKAFIKQAFRQYLSPDVIEQILADPSRLSLGGERRVLTIFFSDLEGFTSISEGMDPHSLTELLNDYLSEMSDIIRRSGGTLDKYEGDAIIAFWNAPLAIQDHAARGLAAAVDCQLRLAELQADYSERAGRPIRMRIGLHTGVVIVGNLGSRDRFDYSMLGDAANLASRLEGVNKVFGTSILASRSTWDAAGGPHVAQRVRGRSLGRVRVKGRAEPVEIFQIRPAAEAHADEIEQAFGSALDLFVQGEFDRAVTAFEALPEDAAARAFAARCRLLAREPPHDWDGVWVLETK